MSTIYVQYINGNLKISINIKANYSLKWSYQWIMQSINVEHQLIEQNFWQEKYFGVRFVTQKSDRERKINSKPRVASRLSASSLLRARVWDRRNVSTDLMVVQAKKRLELYFLGHGVDRFVFFSAPIPLNAVVIINFLCNLQCAMWGVSNLDQD